MSVNALGGAKTATSAQVCAIRRNFWLGSTRVGKRRALTTSESTVQPEAAAAAQPSLGVRVFQNTVAQLAGRGLAILCSAAASVLLARYLGPQKLGEYGAIYAYLFLFSFISTFGLEPILTREVSVRRDQAAELFRTGTLTALGFSIAGAVIATLAAPSFGYSGLLRWLIAVAAIDLLILPPLKLPSLIFQVDMRIWYAVIIGSVRQVLWVLAVVLLALRNGAFYEVIVARTLCGMAEYAVLLWALHKTSLIKGEPSFIPGEARQLLRNGLPVVLSTVAISVYQRIDQVMLHKMSGDLVLAPYVVAVQMTELFNALPVALMISLFPALSRSAQDPARFDHYLRTSFRLLLLVAFAVCALIIPVAGPLVRFFYGVRFAEAAPFLVVLIWSDVPIFFTVVMNNAIVARHLQNHLPFFAVLGAVSNVALNLFLIPKYGALGACWATVLSYSLAGVLGFLVFESTRRLVFIGLRLAVVPFLLVLALTMTLHWVDWMAWEKLLISALAYFFGTLLVRALLPEDLRRLWAMLRQTLS